MTNRRMLLTGVALSTGLLLVGEGCMGATPRGAGSAVETPQVTAAAMATTEEAKLAPRPFTPHHRAPATDEVQLAAAMEDEGIGAPAALAIDGERPCRFMKAQAGNTKGPSYVDVCVR